MKWLSKYFTYLKTNKAVVWIFVICIGGMIFAYYQKSLDFFIYHFIIFVLSALVTVVDAEGFPVDKDEES